MNSMMDYDDEDVDVATDIERGLVMATVLVNDHIIGGPASAGMIVSARKTLPVKAAKLYLGVASNETRVVRG